MTEALDNRPKVAYRAIETDCTVEGTIVRKTIYKQEIADENGDDIDMYRTIGRVRIRRVTSNRVNYVDVHIAVMGVDEIDHMELDTQIGFIGRLDVSFDASFNPVRQTLRVIGISPESRLSYSKRLRFIN